MAHFMYLPPNSQLNTSGNSSGRRHSVPLPQPPQSQSEMQVHNFTPSSSNRNDSLSSNEGSDLASPVVTSYTQFARRNSAMATQRGLKTHDSQTIRTRSIPGGFGTAGVVFERDEAPPNDEDVIIVTVRLTNKFRKNSVDGSDHLPSRPPRRSFIRRLSTRVNNSWDHAAEKEERYKALKMPRGEYKRHFRRDQEGNYVGTEPEREWDVEELMREYGAYQDVPLHSITC